VKDLREVTVPEAVLGLFAALVLGTVLFGAATSASAFGAFNYGWDGTTDLRGVAEETTESAVLEDTSAYERLPGEGSLVVVLGPTDRYSQAERERIEAFVRRGGTLLVGGDFGTAGNDLLAGIGASTRIDGALLRDERHYAQSPSLPIARNVTGIEGVEELALNYPSAVTVPEDANVSVLARTSTYAYADANRNGELDDSETMRSYPILTREPIGTGAVLTLSDPSVFINSMLDRGDNRELAGSLFADFDRVRFDYTHAGGIPPLVATIAVLRSGPLVGFLFGTVLVIGAVLATRAWTIRNRGESPPVEGTILSEDEIVDLVARRHPDWDRERVRRIARQLVARRANGGNNRS